jgi:LysM repeat protein
VLAIGVVLMLISAGCFRPATEVEPQVVLTQPIPSGMALDAPTTPPDGALPPITLIAPEGISSTFATEPPPITVIAPPDAGSGAQLQPALTLVTLAVPTATPEPTQPIATVAPTFTLQVITPGISLGLITPDATSLPTRTATGDPATPVLNLDGTPLPTSAEAVNPVSADGCEYTVRPGDSLYAIAVSQGTTVNLMRAANPDLVGDPPILQIGQVLRLPGCVPGLITTTTPGAPEASPTGETLPAGATVYIVRSGDTLVAIAQRNGVTVRAIVAANNLTNPDALSVGQRLIIPPRGG